MILAAIALAFAGFLLLALGMDRHRRSILGSPATSQARIATRAAGAILLFASLLCCLGGWDWRQALVVWFGGLSVGVVATALTLTLLSRER